MVVMCSVVCLVLGATCKPCLSPASSQNLHTSSAVWRPNRNGSYSDTLSLSSGSPHASSSEQQGSSTSAEQRRMFTGFCLTSIILISPKNSVSSMFYVVSTAGTFVLCSFPLSTFSSSKSPILKAGAGVWRYSWQTGGSGVLRCKL